MNMTTSIRPTTTRRVRDFLGEQGLAPRPWSTLDETYSALYGLLRSRRDDNAFWKPLAGLVRDIVADAADGPRRLPARHAELLRSWDVEELVRDLRRALPGDCAPAGDHRGFARALGAPVLGGFLVLGLAAVGCDNVEEPGGGGGGGGDETPTWAADCSLDDGSEIYAAIDDNEEISTGEKTDLCKCMAAMQTDWQSDLSAVFEECGTEEIAYVLEELVGQCDDEAGVLSEDPTDLADGMCFGQPAYKGVAFPS
jgi:hypothetical protein